MSNQIEPEPAGYAQWASWIASDADNETFVFRKFDGLSAVNLLYLQSEMLEIEAELKQMNRDATGSPNMRLLDATRTWESLVEQCKERQTYTNFEEQQAYNDAKKRMQLVLKLRSTVKEYQNALLLQSRISQLPAPNGRVLGALRQMFTEKGFPFIDGKASGYLNEKKDLVALKQPTGDALSNYLRKALAVQTPEADGLPRIGRFDESRITKWVNVITILVAAIFLIGPILALYYAPNLPAKLTLIAVFTAGFAASIALITNARRPEIFAGTATYAAVLVVFISNGDLPST
ncbi:hypothetical protein GGR54DRAFT_243778 [Hypoxylon sp. NC1633]|nr:hypothetical protein GGR54DRAFT_243778 [Hypoxylon sp. NC1633]